MRFLFSIDINGFTGLDLKDKSESFYFLKKKI